MLKLINIKKDDETISADYVPENSGIQAHISLNFITREHKDEEIPGYGAMYSAMALNGLRKIIKELQTNEISEVPKTRNVVWF